MIMNHKNCERRIPKDNRNFVKKFLDFKDIKFLVKITDIHKNEKNTSALVFLVMKIRKNIQFMNQKNVVKKNILIYYQ